MASILKECEVCVELPMTTESQDTESQNHGGGERDSACISNRLSALRANRRAKSL